MVPGNISPVHDDFWIFVVLHTILHGKEGLCDPSVPKDMLRCTALQGRIWGQQASALSSNLGSVDVMWEGCGASRFLSVSIFET